MTDILKNPISKHPLIVTFFAIAILGGGGFLIKYFFFSSTQFDATKYCDIIIDNSQITDGGIGIQNNSGSRICIRNGSIITRNGINIQNNQPVK